MKFIIFCCLFFTGSSAVSAQSPSTIWVRHFGGGGNDEINCLEVDATGNIYFSGSFEDSISFHTEKGEVKLVSKNNENLFLAKMDEKGILKWVKQIHSNCSSAGLAIAIDDDNNIYLTGTFNCRADFDMGPDSFFLNAEIQDELFFLKTDSNGNFIWAFDLYGRSFKSCTSMTTDKEGNLYATGYFHLWVDFMPGIGTRWLSSMVSNEEMITDMFVMKLNKAGQLVWVQQARSEKNMNGHDIEIDLNSNVYITGIFSGRTQFSQDASIVLNTSPGIENGDIFVAKYNSTGKIQWAKSIRGKGLDSGNGIDVDSEGNIVTTGQYYGSMDIDPGSGDVEVTGNGILDVYVQKLNSRGEFLWGKSFGGKSSDKGKNVFFISSGDIISVGKFENSMDADPGEGTQMLGNEKGQNGFIQQLDQHGNLKWASEIQNINSCSGTSATNNQMIIYGSFRNEIDGNPGDKVQELKSRGKSDLYIIKLDAGVR